MPKVTNENSNTNENILLFIGYPLAKMGLVLPTQPLVNLMVDQQKNSTSFTTSFQRLRQKGSMRFFKGTLPSMIKEGQKSAYKGWLTANAQDWSETILSVLSPNSSSEVATNLLAGGISGTVDAAFSGPVERYKTYALSQDQKTSFTEFSRELHNRYRHLPAMQQGKRICEELWKGFGTTSVKQSTMLAAFFLAFTWSNKEFSPYKEVYPNLTKAGVSIFSGCIAAIAAAPLDVAKTLIQKDIGGQSNLLNQLAQVYDKAGAKGLTRGVGAKCVLTATGYGFTALFLNHIKETRNERLRQIDDSQNELLQKMSVLTLNDHSEKSKNKVS